MAELRLPAHEDPRGTLVPIEDVAAGFEIRRVFTVAGVPGGSSRGGHRPGCRELIVLVLGGCEVNVDRGAGVERHALVSPGDAVQVGPDDLVDYVLADQASVVVVVCDAPYGRQA